jgi:hypothetical protein
MITPQRAATQRPSYIQHYFSALLGEFKPLTLRQWQALTARITSAPVAH